MEKHGVIVNADKGEQSMADDTKTNTNVEYKQLTIRLPLKSVQQLDDVRKSEGDLPSRTVMIRRLIERTPVRA